MVGGGLLWVCLRTCDWRWVVVAGGVCGGLRVGLAVMVVISGDFGCGFCFILFYVAPNTQCKIFSKAFF